FHPGEDWNLSSRPDDDANAEVRSVANGVVVRIADIGARGYFVMVSSCMTEQRNWSNYVLPVTSIDDPSMKELWLSDLVTVNYGHLSNNDAGHTLQVHLGDYIGKGQLLGYVKPALGHLHLEAIAGFENSIAGTGSSDGNYREQQQITNFNT